LIDTIREREAFVRLRREGSRHRIEPLWCSFVPDSQLTPPKVAFAIGRPIGSAVTRNRVRRRLRAVLADSSVPPGLLLIGADPAIVELTFDELRERTRQLLERLTTTPT
jgi:ribonuclease P protein component